MVLKILHMPWLCTVTVMQQTSFAKCPLSTAGNVQKRCLKKNSSIILRDDNLYFEEQGMKVTIFRENSIPRFNSTSIEMVKKL